jgi:hypothetical protein
MKLEQLAYVSTATAPGISSADVADILAASLRNNPANNITGALAFTDTRYLQLLEGSHGSLDVLILKLMIDTRHRDLIFIDRAPISERSFATWSMAVPAVTPFGKERLDDFVAGEMKPMADFQRLLLDLVADPT